MKDSANELCRGWGRRKDAPTLTPDLSERYGVEVGVSPPTTPTPDRDRRRAQSGGGSPAQLTQLVHRKTTGYDFREVIDVVADGMGRLWLSRTSGGVKDDG
ncbi:hypothetical protein CRG98_010508 [Punica granatum]|uniref:Uncharacterized protein n=1 Tax=Punica granatum TaxID=22663 RepID=A0A2I0KKS3_PUNGR|nr:hypothetical protein CRG98_010508 [Punica granatum]